MKGTIKFVLLIAFIVCFAAGAHPQSCRGSHVTYLIRDAKGKPMDAASSSVAFEKGSSRASQRWKVSIKQWMNSRWATLPPKIARLNGNTSGLTTSEFCNFREPATLNVIIGGKTMSLTFKFPPMSEQESADFIVDSLPFKAGKYEITLAKPANGYDAYYAPTGWKKSM